jgi:hypothetical protein
MKLEIVTSIYNDEHKSSWVNTLPKDILITIYNKGQHLKNISNYINIPNYGRCDYSFLWHIIHNYDKLLDKIIFTKINWHDHSGCDLNNLLNKCKIFDFCDVGEHEEYNVWIPSIEEKEKYLSKINHPNICYTILTNKNNDKYKTLDIQEIYLKIFNKSSLPKNKILWGQGPCFSVSKELILRHPKSVYENLLNLFHGKNIQDNEEAQKEMINEIGKLYHDRFLRFWKTLFTHEIDESKFKIEYH